jgi:hypothetical protein
MYTLKKVGIMSVAKFTALIFAFIGLILGILTALLGNIITQAIADALSLTGVSTTNPLSGLTVFIWIAAFTIFPLVWAIIGFVTGIIISLIFNLIAKTGGLKIDLALEDTPVNIQTQRGLINSTTVR